MHYYNEIDPKAAAWLEELIRGGHIPAGKVDTRSICDVQADDVSGFTQCHFFAGIGGWPLALKLAKWPENRPVWTGSCPCQPFSAAGKQLGEKDERHLWPEFFRLIKACRPVVVFGEQVERAVGLGWLDGVFADLEGEDYTTGAAVLGAHSVNAPHIRQRLYWLADSSSSRCDGSFSESEGEARNEARLCVPREDVSARGMDNASGPRLEGHAGYGDDGHQPRRHDADTTRSTPETGCISAWSDFYLLPMRDGKTRRVESGSFPLAHGIPGRVGLLRGYGNAIVPQVAAEFIGAYLDIEGGI